MNVGDYVRTKKGTIYQFNSTSSKALSGAKKYMVKSSPNIIDLIEVGDYVNRLPVRFVEENRVDIGQEENYLWLKNEHIKSIVTREMFESMEYKVGE